MAIDADRIRKPTRKLRKFLKKLPKDPTPVQIRHFRTHVRRFETAVEAFGLRKEHSRLLRDLERLRKHAGPVRDADALTCYLLTVRLKAEQECLVRLAEALGGDRTEKARKLRASAEKRGPRLRRSLKQTASRLRKVVKKAEHSSSTTPDIAAETMARAFRRKAGLNTPTRLTRANLHSFRLKVKETRDRLQLARDPERQEFVKELIKVSRAIGEWHDWEKLFDLAGDVLDHGASCGVLKSLRTIREKKFGEALAAANRMRKGLLRLQPSRPARPSALQRVG